MSAAIAGKACLFEQGGVGGDRSRREVRNNLALVDLISVRITLKRSPNGKIMLDLYSCRC